MSVKVKESTLVCPAEETPRHSLWLSRIDMIARMPYSHSPLFYIYSPNEDVKGSKCFDTKILREALSRILVPFYPVAGRLKKNEENGRIEIDCNSNGVLFQEVETTHCLADFEGFKPTTELRNLIIPRCDYSGSLSSFPLLLVRVTRFECGGVCIGFGNHHHIADGVGFINFINSWSRLVRGLELDVHPIFDRTVCLAPRDPPQVKFRHLEYEPPLPPFPPKGFSGGMTTTKEGLFKFSKRQIDILKLQARFPSKEIQSYNPSTYEVLAGHVWRSACKARGLIGDQHVKLYIPTDGRSRLKDPILPQEYFGNVVFFTACIAKACDITSKPLWYAVSKVHDALQKMEDIEYLRSAIDYLEQQSDLTTLVRGPHTVTCPNLSINSWGRLPFYEADFSLGKPKFVGHGGIRYEGQSFFIPSPNDNGSFSLSINLFTVHMTLFENYLNDFVSLSCL